MSTGTSRWFERRQARERRAESEVSDLKRTLKLHSAIRGEEQSERRVEQKRRERLRLARAAEAKQGAIMQQKMQQDAIQRHLDAQQNALCQELQLRRSAEASENATRRRIVEQSEELRDLQLKLNAAQISKERAEQDRINAIIQAEKKKQEAEEEQRLADMRKQADENDEFERVQAQRAFKAELDQQMEYRRQEKQKAFESFVEEKKQIDEVVAGVLDDEKKQREQKWAKRFATRTMMQKYDAERNAVKKRLREEEQRELQRIEEWTKFQDERIRQIEAKKAEHAAAEASKYRRVAAGMDIARKEQEETEELLIELFIAEADRKIEEQAKAREERRLRLKQEMMEANRLQQILGAERRRQEKEQEDLMCKQMMEKFAEDDRLEQMNAERRRRMKHEHRAEVQRLLADRRALYEKERKLELQERDEELRQEQARLQIVEEERERLLRDYARKLREYLPRGVIRNQADLHIVFGEPDPSTSST